jgi:hypothetical protein
MLAIKDENGCGKLQTISQLSASSADYIETIIPANEEIFIRAIYMVGSTTCNAVGSFYASENSEYIIHPVIGPYICAFNVTSNNSDENHDLKKAYWDNILGSKICTNEDDL